MQVMRVMKPGGLDQLRLLETESVSPADGEVQVRWRASSLNFHDYMVALGAIPTEDGRIPMSDGAGEITAVGEGVSKWKIGDKVMSTFFCHWIDDFPAAKHAAACYGDTVDGFAVERSCISADSITAIPDGYSFQEAATLPCAAVTAWRGLVEEGNLQSSDKVLIQGSGGVSIFGLQIAEAMGATIYATTSSDEKAEKLKSLGAAHVINYRDDEKWGKTIFKMSDGGVDQILDVGGPTTLPQAIEASAIGANIAVLGVLGGRDCELVLPKLFFKQITLNGIAVGSRVMQERMVAFINQHKIRPVIDKSFQLGDLAKAFEHQASGAHFGKITIEI